MGPGWSGTAGDPIRAGREIKIYLMEGSRNIMLPMIFGENLFDDLFNDAFERSMWNTDKALYGKRASQLMKTDVHETEEGYELNVDLPGFSKDEINVELKNGYLTISAAKGLDKEETDKKTKRVIRQERYSGSCSRSFYVGEDVQQEDIKAEFKHGILKLFVPKKEAKPVSNDPKYITIE
mgnify:CR=1 FL=1